MDEDKKQQTTTNTNTTVKSRSIANWFVIILGAIICAAGVFSWFSEDDEINIALIETGTAQTCCAFVREYPESKDALNNTAAAIEAAIEARQISPDKLASLVNNKLSELANQNIQISSVIVVIINKINNAYETSETEEQYIKKLNAIVAGIKTTFKSFEA